MAKRDETKDFQKFLKERNLARVYSRWLSTRPLRKRVIDVAFPTYDGVIRQTKLYVYRSRTKTIFKDFYTMQTLGYSRRKVDSAIRTLFEKADIKGKGKRDVPLYHTNKKTGEKKVYKIAGWDVNYNIRKSGIKLKNEFVKKSYNETLKRLRYVTSTNVVRSNMVGLVVVDVTYVKGDIKKRFQTRSSYGFLNNKDVREKLISQALRAGSFLAEFTPSEIIIHAIWYEYWEDKHADVTKIRQ